MEDDTPTIDLENDINLDDGQDLPPMVLEPGWRKMYFTDFERVVKDLDTDKPKDYWMLSLQDDETGWARRAFLNRPLPGDETIVAFTDRSGNEITRRGSKIAVIRKVIGALGGPESGSINDQTLAGLVGRAAMFLVVNEVNKETGELRDNVDLKFGKGIRPV